MKTLSDKDYALVKRITREVQRLPGNDLKTRNIQRRAALLFRKMDGNKKTKR